MWETLIIEPFLNVLVVIYSLLVQLFGTSEHMFGLAIIIFTILIKLLTHPLTASQTKSMKAMQELQQSKAWQDMQKKYKNDREKMSQEQLKLYKEAGVNPFGSCLPLLVQFPIIIGLYQSILRGMADSPLPLLRLSESLYGIINPSQIIPLNSHFLWMDLGQPERIYIAGFGLPFLAILVAVTTYFQSKLMSPAQVDPNNQGAQMSRMMNIYMPLMLGYFAYSFASGLAVYFVISNLMTVVQYAMMGQLDWSKLIPNRKPARAPSK
jgi:YidC/Oxa1 family membrane protein insertase